MTLPALAWKNMLRYGRRTAITAGAIAVGLTAYLAMDSLLLGMELESERNLIWYETGSAKVLHPAYWEEREELPLDLPISEPYALARRLGEKGIPATPRIAFAAELVVQRDPYPEDGSIYVHGYGIDLGTDGEVFRLGEHVVDGRWLDPDENGIVLGSTLAERLGAEVGFPLIIVTRTQEGYYQTIDAEVVGIVATPNPVVNRTSVFMPIHTVALYLQMEGQATEVALHLRESLPLREALAPVEATLEELSAAPSGSETAPEVLSWRVLASDYVAIAEAKASAGGIILLLVFVIAAVGISNTMIMAVFERTGEIGTLRALGMPERRVRLLFLYEAGAVGAVGSIAGLFLGAVATYALVRWGIDYSAMMEGIDVGYRTTGLIRGAWHPRAFATAAIVGVLLSVVSAFLPTQHAVGRSVPDCLRYQR